MFAYDVYGGYHFKQETAAVALGFQVTYNSKI